MRDSRPRLSLDDLPPLRQRELARILHILLEGFEAWQASKLSGKKKRGRILKVILYGSQARGTAVENKISGYVSDYDILVVVNDETFTDFEVWEETKDRLFQETTLRRIHLPVSVIVHALQDVNDQLSRGRYFWMDVVAEGIPLYEAEGFDFVEAKPLSPEVAREEAEGYFEEYLPLSHHTLRLAGTSIKEGVPRYGAFLLHQSAEHAYYCLLLTLTLYVPLTHNLKDLHKRALDLDPRFFAIWGEGRAPYGRGGAVGKRCFELLKDAYVKARYSKRYRITEEELGLLTKRVTELQALVETVCQERLKE